ncbi:MAG: EfeM/EfeO family lipoprotein [Planctomycetota bacterium]
MLRRDVVKASLAAGMGLAAGSALGCTTRLGATAVRRQAAGTSQQRAAVTAGLAYFQRRCEDQKPLVRALADAIASGDLSRAKRAYVESRPPYEEIEVLAASFEVSDSDIDARPYSFERGETDPEFRGFHKVEALIFAYEDLDAALPFARGLVRSVERLSEELGELDRFSVDGQFAGMYAVSNEVAAKKISSEEEAWSDQSLLIFRHNWIGVYSQFEPFAPLLAEQHQTHVDRVADAYRAARATVERHFSAGSAAGTPYSRIGIVERRTIADASNRLRDAIAGAAEAMGVDVLG